MKTTQTLILATFIVTALACSKQESTDSINETPMAEMPVMEKTPAIESPADSQPSKLLPNEISKLDTETAIEQDDSGKKVIYWEDPMVPDRRFSKSGQSPFMDMKLSPRYAE